MQLMKSEYNYKINEEKLMNIMLQCLKALSYLNYCGIIFCGIKPDRILIDNDFNIKFTNFKYACIYDEKKFKKNLNIEQFDKKSLLNDYAIINIGNYKAPEMKQGNKYDKKIDVYSLGIVFCYLAYSTYKLPEKNGDYSIELYNFIKKMVNDCPTSRPKATEAYQELKNIYLKKYFNNSSIISYLRCLTSFPNMKDNFLRRVSKLLKEGKNPILKKLYNFIDIIQKTKKLNLQSEKTFNEKIKEEINEEIYDFLSFLQEQRIFNLKYKKEMTPKELSFILFKLIESELKLLYSNNIIQFIQ
jgi:serine/threonine protein kinase